MPILSKVFAATSVDQSVLRSNFWFEPVGAPTSSGINVTAEKSLKVAAVYAAVRLISQTVGMLPLFVFRRRPDGSISLFQKRARNESGRSPCMF